MYAETIDSPSVVSAVNTESSPLIATKPSSVRRNLPSGVQQMLDRGTLGADPVSQANPRMWMTEPRQWGRQHTDA